MERAQKLMPRVPIVTLALTLSFICVYYWPGSIEQTLYNRQAILGGELWRILSAPLTHFSISHLFWNTSIFTIFGVMIEGNNRVALLTICGGTALLTGLVYLLFSPEMTYYGGISGVASGIVFYLAISNVYSGSKNKRLWQLILFLLVLKLAVEFVTSNPIFVSVETSRFLVLSSAHLIGVAVAFSFWIWELRATIARHVIAQKRYAKLL